MSTSDSPKLDLAWWFKRCIAALIGLAFLYFLSAGPALMLAQRRMISTDAVEAFISPLETFTLIVPGANWLFMRYIKLWSKDDP